MHACVCVCVCMHVCMHILDGDGSWVFASRALGELWTTSVSDQ